MFYLIYDTPVRSELDQAVISIQTFIHKAIEEYNSDTEDITLLGLFSQGAVLAQSLALTMGKTIKKVVAPSGYIPCFVKGKDPLP